MRSLPRKLIALTALPTLLILTACVPDAPPAPYRSDRCAYSQQIMDVWAGTGDEHWAVDTAIRESGCDPCAFYPGRSDCFANPSTARGMFQLLGHYDIEQTVCPGHYWSDAMCGIWGGKLLYDLSGRRPWGG